MESHFQNRKRISAAEPRPSPQSSQSQIQESSISPGQRISPRNIPPIVTKDAKAPQNAQSYLSARRSFENQEDNQDMDIEDDVSGNEDGQEAALSKLWRHMRHFNSPFCATWQKTPDSPSLHIKLQFQLLWNRLNSIRVNFLRILYRILHSVLARGPRVILIKRRCNTISGPWRS